MRKMDKNTLVVVALMSVVAVVSLFDKPIADSVDCIEEVPVLQSWIGAVVGGIVSLASSLAGGVMANKASQERSEAYDSAWGEYEDWYKGQMGTNILDRADSQAMLKAYRDWQEENARKYQTNAIKGGASEEAKIAYAQKANEGYADVVSRIAAQGQQYKDRLSQQYAGKLFDYKTKRADMTASGSQAVADTVVGAGGTIGDIVGGMDWGSGSTNGLSAPKGMSGKYDPTADYDWGEEYS